MKIKCEFYYSPDADEIADEFCDHSSDYQAEAFNLIGLMFKIWSLDETKIASYMQILEIAEQLDQNGKWFIKTLAEYIDGDSGDNEK
jgi:hypothetical protein